MKSRFHPIAFLSASLALAATALVTLAPRPARGQSPFNSSQPPISNPYGGGGGNRGALLPSNSGATREEPLGVPGAAAANPYAANPGLGAGTMNLENIGTDYKLRRGDQLAYQVKEDRDPQTVLAVTDSGEFIPPYLGRGISAAGKTVGQLQGEVKAALERDLYQHATVQIGLMRVAPRGSKGRIDISGPVRLPGAMELPTDEALTVSKACMRAGFKDFADQNKVILMRSGGPSKGIRVKVKDVIEGRETNDPVLQPGDILVVKERLINW